MVKPTVISTFAGCGGSSLGYQMAGFKELLAMEKVNQWGSWTKTGALIGANPHRLCRNQRVMGEHITQLNAGH